MTKSVLKKSVNQFDKGCFLVGSILLLFFLQGSCLAQSVVPPVEDIRDIMVRRPPASVVPVIVSIVVLVAALITGFLALRKFLRKAPETKRLPPEVIARVRLSEISGQVDELPPNKASLETSEAIKDFMTAQYKDPIRFETAEEYLTRITDAEEGVSKLSQTLTEEVRSFMSISQELKFAQIREARSQIPALIEQAERIVGIAVQERQPSTGKQ